MRRRSLGFERARIAPLLTGDDLAEMLALADFCLACGGSHHCRPPEGVSKRLIELKLVERAPLAGAPRGNHIRRLTTLGWLTLLTRAEKEMAHLLPREPEA